MQVHILGNGPITLALAKRIRNEYRVQIYSDHRNGVTDAGNILPYKSFLRIVPKPNDIIFLAWKGLPNDWDIRYVILDQLVDVLGATNSLFNLSSVAVYGNTVSPAVENQYPDPINEYGRSKHAMETYCDENFRCVVRHLRISNVFGDHKFSDVVNKLLEAGTHNTKLSLFNPNEMIRNYISLDSVTNLLNMILIRSTLLPHREIFNIASDFSTNLTEIRNLIELNLGRTINIVSKEATEDTILKSFISNRKISNLTQFKSMEDLTLRRYIKSFILESQKNEVRNQESQ